MEGFQNSIEMTWSFDRVMPDIVRTIPFDSSRDRLDENVRLEEVYIIWREDIGPHPDENWACNRGIEDLFARLGGPAKLKQVANRAGVSRPRLQLSRVRRDFDPFDKEVRGVGTWFHLWPTTLGLMSDLGVEFRLFYSATWTPRTAVKQPPA